MPRNSVLTAAGAVFAARWASSEVKRVVKRSTKHYCTASVRKWCCGRLLHGAPRVLSGWAALEPGLPFGGRAQIMQAITTIGLDIAKSVFQVHGVDVEGNVVVRRQLKRRYVVAFFQKLPLCLVGIEACASSHYWSRVLQALGHTVCLMPPAYLNLMSNDRRTMRLTQKRFAKPSPGHTCASCQRRCPNGRAA
jgi:hypothetical protein